MGKEHLVLRVLFDHLGSYITGKDLSKQIGLSERTVRTYINYLKVLINEHGGEIISKQGSGYCLEIKNSLKFDKFIAQINDSKIQKDSKKIWLQDSTSRQTFILRELVYEGKIVNVDDLSFETYISKTKLYKELNSIKELLSSYDLCIKNKYGLGIYVEGKEINKRKFIIDYFFKDFKKEFIQFNLSKIPYFKEYPLEKIMIIIVEECKNNKIHLSDIMLQNILIHTILSIKRIENKMEIKKIVETDKFYKSIEYETANKIVIRLKKDLNINFPDEEIAYLTLHLKANNYHDYQKENQTSITLEKEIQNILKDMYEETNILLYNDEYLIKCLVNHLNPMLIRIDKNIKMNNPLTQHILDKYKKYYDLTKKYLSRLERLRGKEISTDEWAYLTLHIMASIENMEAESILRVILVCATGLGSANLLKRRIKKEYEDHIEIVDTISFYDLNEDKIKDVDLILTTVNLDNLVLKTPVLKVSVFLEENDKKIIQDFITKASHKIDSTKVSNKNDFLSLIEKRDLLKYYIPKENVRIFNEKVNRTTVINCLINLLKSEEDTNYFSKMNEQILLREKIGSIVFSDYVAVPHPLNPVGKNSRVSLAVMKQGIYWNSHFKNVKFIFLISPSYIENIGLENVTKAIVNFCESDFLQNKILDNLNYDQIILALNECI